MIADCEKIATSLVIAFINPSYITDVLFPLHECVRLVENHTSPTIDIWIEKTSRVELTYVSNRRYIICHFGTKFSPQLSRRGTRARIRASGRGG